MTTNAIIRAGLVTAALAVFIWYFSFFRPVVEAEILVIDKDLIEWPHKKPPIYIATIIAEGNVLFGIARTPDDMTQKELYAFLEPGCIYAITYFDDALVLHRASREGGDAKTIRRAKKLSCPASP
jgi:hypothetical protein